MSKGYILDNRGAATTRTLFWVVFLAVCFYIGYLLVPPYATFYLFKTEVEDEAKLAHMYNNAELAKRIYVRAEAWNVPIGLGDIMVSRDKEDVNVTVFYVVTIDVAGFYQRDLEYYVDVIQPIKETSGILHH